MGHAFKYLSNNKDKAIGEVEQKIEVGVLILGSGNMGSFSYNSWCVSVHLKIVAIERKTILNKSQTFNSKTSFLLLHSTHFIYPEVEKTYGKCDNYSQVLTLFPFALTVRLDDDDLEMLKNTFVYKANAEESGGTA